MIASTKTHVLTFWPVKLTIFIILYRCQNAVNNNVKIDLKVDDGKWLNLKKNPTPAESQVPYVPIQGWKKFPSVSIPKHFNHGYIYYYLVESVECDSNSSDDDCEDDVHTSKPFTKGMNFFRSGHVKNIHDVSCKGHYFVKASVLASYSQHSYNCIVTLSESSGSIIEGTCTCSASGMGRCSHVAALLFALEDYTIEFGTDLPTCTDKLLQWNKGRRKKKNPETIFNKEYKSMKKTLNRQKTSVKNILNSDPRPEELREDELSNEQKNEFLSNLVLNGQECGWTNLLDFYYENFSIDEYDVDILKIQCRQFIDNLKDMCSDKCYPFVVDNTVGQASSLDWQVNRWCRVTASTPKDIKCARTGMTSIVNRLLWSDTPVTAALLYGREHESNALSHYKQQHPNYSVQETGLWLNPKHPTLGCSPDGIFIDKLNETKGLVEIKCPYVLRNCNPLNFIENLSTKQCRNFCCVKDNQGKLRLKRITNTIIRFKRS